MIEYHMRAVCDKCKTEIEPMTQVKFTYINSQRWDWKLKWKKLGVMLGLPNRFGKRYLYCSKCAGS